MEPEDLELLYKIENNYKLWACGTTNVLYSHYLLHDYIAQSTGDIYTDKQVRFIICNQDNKCVGIIDLVNFNPKHLRAEVGIVIQKAYRNKGYAEAALEQLIRYATNTLHLHQLYALVATDNQASKQLFKAVNFHCNATLKDWLFDGRHHFDADLWQLILP